MIVKDKRFYKTYYSLTAVMAVQSLISFGVNLADNIMLGAYSEAALSGAALVNQIQFLLHYTVNGVGSGIMVLASQYWGKQNVEVIRRIIAIGVKFAALIGVIFFIVIFFWPYQVLNILTNDQAVIASGMEYMKLMCFTFIIFSIENTLIFSLRSVETTIIGPITSTFSLLMNILLNYIFIFGNFGVPEMGVTGAALATLISRIFELLMVLIYIKVFDKKLDIKIMQWFMPDWVYLKDYLVVSIPIVMTGAFWGIAQMAQTAILGHVSAMALTANSIATIVYQIAAVFAFSSSNSSSVMMGKTIGEGKFDLIKPYTVTFQLLFLANGIIAGAALFLLKDFILSFYSISPETRELARNFMLLLSIFIISSAYEYPIECGIIAGGGHTKYAFIVDTVCMWLFTIPFSYLSAFVWGFPPLITFIFLKADQFIKSLINGIYVNRYKWIRVLTR